MKAARTPSVRVGICIIVKNEARYIEEWLAFHIAQGVSHIIVYDNESSDQTGDIAKNFSFDANITVLHWPMVEIDFDAIQRSAYMDGAKRMIGVVDFVAFIDIDEFLYSTNGCFLPDSLAEFNSDISAIAVTQRAFGSSGHRQYAPDLVTSRFVMCSSLNNSESHWFKTIARPEMVLNFDSVHSVKLREGKYVLSDGGSFLRPFSHPGFANRSTDGTIRINHYILKSYEEFCWKKERWRANDKSGRYVDEYYLDKEAYANKEYNTDIVKSRANMMSMKYHVPPCSYFACREVSGLQLTLVIGVKKMIRKVIYALRKVSNI